MDPGVQEVMANIVRRHTDMRDKASRYSELQFALLGLPYIYQNLGDSELSVTFGTSTPLEKTVAIMRPFQDGQGSGMEMGMYEYPSWGILICGLIPGIHIKLNRPNAGLFFKIQRSIGNKIFQTSFLNMPDFVATQENDSLDTTTTLLSNGILQVTSGNRMYRYRPDGENFMSVYESLLSGLPVQSPSFPATIEE